MTFKKIIIWGVPATVFIGLLAVYKIYDPLSSDFFPRCPFHLITGFLCPGCGSQRSLHHLLNLDLKPAAEANLLLVASLPYVLTGIGFELKKQPSQKALRWRKLLFGKKAIYILLTIIISFWIFRNL